MTEETTLLLVFTLFCFCLEVGAPLMRAGGGGVPRTLPLPMEGVKLLRDGPLAKATFFCCVFCFNITKDDKYIQNLGLI